ncbi:flagellar FliJ protein [Tibeticola sediminis]|uniref:Flagellar FliJ protein n=1 Tax=Tibeticola sediminis TaxID=1917811 RepID=A0A3N4V9T5_9BURK|nr:flagellar export protein FliJ [Tibeticola sediminis]RPE70580.1 flagellar FliJ protein [Tibeticola sediminis]
MTSATAILRRAATFEKLRADADAEQQRLARLLKAHQDTASDARRKLEQLQVYRAEYLERMRALEAQPGRWGEVRGMRAFLLRLDEAIRAQEAEVDRTRAAVDQATGAWTQARQRVMAFDQLSERQREELRALAVQEGRRELQEWSALAATGDGSLSRPAPL